MKKKILFIAHNFPPSEVIADIRASNIARGLANNDFDVTVLTVNEDYIINRSENVQKNLKNVKIIRINHFFRFEGMNTRGNSFFPKIFRRVILKLLPLVGLDFVSFSHNSAIKEIMKRNEKYDFVIATGPPFSSFSLAKKIAKKMNSIYILDYRDLWSLSPHDMTKRNFFHIKKEKRIIEKASLVLFVSNSMQKTMHKKFKIKNSIILTNGYNKTVFTNIPRIKFKKFTISYVGNFYLPKRNIDPIFKALKILKDKNKKIYNSINFIYCGGAGDYIQQKSKEFDIADIVENRFLVSRDEAFSVTKSSNLSIVITTVLEKGSLSDNSIITGKVFEALGMNTKILCISPLEGDIRKTISENNRGYNATGMEEIKIANFIEQEYNNGRFESNDNSEYDWNNLILKLVDQLNNN